jgi:hypothetical protein
MPSDAKKNILLSIWMRKNNCHRPSNSIKEFSINTQGEK